MILFLMPYYMCLSHVFYVHMSHILKHYDTLLANVLCASDRTTVMCYGDTRAQNYNE